MAEAKSHFMFCRKGIFVYFKCKQRRVIKKQFIFRINSFIALGTRCCLMYSNIQMEIIMQKEINFGILGINFIKIHE